MQNQLTPGQSNLQQSNNNLQPNSSDLQESGAPNTSSDVSTVLSQNAQNTGLQVQSAKTDPSIPAQTYLPGSSASAWIVPLAFALAVIVALVAWSRLRQQIVAIKEEKPEVVEQPKPAQVSKKQKTGKKTTRRKRQNKR